jgi:hypothetical protein
MDDVAVGTMRGGRRQQREGRKEQKRDEVRDGGHLEELQGKAAKSGLGKI